MEKQLKKMVPSAGILFIRGTFINRGSRLYICIYFIYIYICIYMYMYIRLQHCGYTYYTEIDRYVDIHGNDYILWSIYIYTHTYIYIYGWGYTSIHVYT